MPVAFQFRRGTAAEWTAANPTLRAGEPGYETDTGKMKVGTGATPWADLAYVSGGAGGTGGDAAALDGRPASYYLSRANHTGAQPIGSIDGLQEALSSEANARATADAALGGRVSALEAAPPPALAQLTDVQITSPSAGQVIKFDGVRWANGADATSGGAGTNADTLDGQDGNYYLSRANHSGTQPWSTITGRPTTLGGYGITDAATASALSTESTNRATADAALSGRVSTLETAPPTHASRHATGGADPLTPAAIGAAAASHTHAAADVTDATAAGRALLTAASVAAQRTALALGTAALANTGTGASDVPTTAQADARYQRPQPRIGLADAATIAWDVSQGHTASITIAGNRTLANPTNLVDGGTYVLMVRQDATGGRTLSYGSMFRWPGGVAPVLSTAPNVRDILTFVYHAGDGILMGNIVKGYTV